MESDLQVDPDWVAEHLDDPSVRVVEVDVSSGSYDKGHIPGAVLWDAYRDLRHSDYTPIDPDVVFYGYAPYLGFWLTARHGHERIRLMEGSRERWEDAGYPWSSEDPEPESSSYERRGEKPDLVVGRQEMEAMIADRETVIVDVRAKEEFSGPRVPPRGPVVRATCRAAFTSPSNLRGGRTALWPTAKNCGAPARTSAWNPARRWSSTARSGTGRVWSRSR